MNTTLTIPQQAALAFVQNMGTASKRAILDAGFDMRAINKLVSMGRLERLTGDEFTIPAYDPAVVDEADPTTPVNKEELKGLLDRSRASDDMEPQDIIARDSSAAEHRAAKKARERGTFKNGKARKAPKKEPRSCLCGCGQMTKGSRFCMGHDGKLHGAVVKIKRDYPGEDVQRALFASNFNEEQVQFINEKGWA